jgi:hypothetical protein
MTKKTVRERSMKKWMSGFAIGAGLLAPTLAVAQDAPTLATLADVEGRVLISSSTGLVQAAPGAVVREGTRIVVAAGGKVTLVGSKCRLELGAGSELLVEKDLPCPDRQKSAAALPAASTSGLFAGTGTATLVAGAAGVGVIAVAAKRVAFKGSARGF